MMLTDEKLPQFQDRIKTLQAVQTKTLKDKRFSELSEEAKLAFCHRNRRLGDYAYECYAILKSRQNSEFDAVDYFMIAFGVCNEKAYWEQGKII